MVTVISVPSSALEEQKMIFSRIQTAAKYGAAEMKMRQGHPEL